MSWKKLSEEKPKFNNVYENKLLKVYCKDGTQDTLYYDTVYGFGLHSVTHWDELDPEPKTEPTNQEKYDQYIENFKNVVRYHNDGSVSDKTLLTQIAALLVNIMALQVKDD